jgi:DNA-binding NarL/FixJ family response regulator
MEGRHGDALQLLRDAVVHAQRVRSPQDQVQSCGMLADAALQLGLLDEATTAGREAMEFIVGRRYWGPVEYVIAPLAEALAWADAKDVHAVLDQADTFIEKQEIGRARPQVLRAQAIVALRHDQSETAMELLRSSAALARSQHALPQLGRTLAVLAAVAEPSPASASAAELAGVVARIGCETAGLLWANGQLPAVLRAPEPKSWAPLTAREQQVAKLLAQGLTNKQIAEELVIAEGTAGVHVDHILEKLGFHSRTQVAVWVAERGGPKPTK